MYLFILETIGTQELILIGLIALIVFGPRKLPQFARKAGKMMTDFRKMSNDFKSTWEREVAFEEEKSRSIGGDNSSSESVPYNLENGEIATVSQPDSSPALLPEVKEIDAREFHPVDDNEPEPVETKEKPSNTGAEDKENWL